jgi:hypothetical protein
VKEVTVTVPNLTAVAAFRLVPLMVTVLPPATGPTFGEIEAMAGSEM